MRNWLLGVVLRIESLELQNTTRKVYQNEGFGLRSIKKNLDIR